MLRVVVILLLLWILLGVLGALIKGLIWLLGAAIVLFLVTLVIGGALSRRRRPTR